MQNHRFQAIASHFKAKRLYEGKCRFRRKSCSAASGEQNGAQILAQRWRVTGVAALKIHIKRGDEPVWTGIHRRHEHETPEPPNYRDCERGSPQRLFRPRQPKRKTDGGRSSLQPTARGRRLQPVRCQCRCSLPRAALCKGPAAKSPLCQTPDCLSARDRRP